MKTSVKIFLALVLSLGISSQAMAAFSITRTVPGFRLLKYLNQGHPREAKIAGAAATSYTLGQPLILSATTKLLAAAVNGSADIIGVVLKAATTPAATSSSDDHLVLIERNLQDAVFEVNLDAASWLDEGVATAVSTDGTQIAFDAGLTYGNAAVDNSIRGHALVCYSGPGAGEWRYIIDYDAAGGATGSQQVTVNRPFSVLPTTSSYFIILGTGSDGAGFVPGNKADLGSTSASKIKGSDVTGACLIHSLDHAHEGVIEVQFTDRVDQAP